ncbi:MAG: FAD-dependent oxidoreductase [Clostridia bacterium]|nr:FAD-dependent oxidoreductase [Clostridia bacterium]
MDFNLDMNLNDQYGKNKKATFDKETLYDMLIIGSGPAGLSAALYAKRKGLKVGVLSNKVGGQVVDTTSVENYLGFDFVTGEGLVEKFMHHVQTLDVPMLKDADVKSFEKTESGFEVALSRGEIIKSKTLILATGSKPRRLGVKGEDAFIGRGVAYCAICDGPLFEGRDVVVAGGGNSAVEAAIDLSKIANSVTLVHRSEFRADQIIIDQLKRLSNVTIHLQTEIQEVFGDGLVSGVKVLDKATGETRELKIEGLFVEIGYLPNNQLVIDQLDLNNRGEIIVNALNETSMKGVFAAGDVTDTPYKQIIVAASEGAKAALTANDYINRG